MTEEQLEMEEKRIKAEREYMDVRQAITTFRCPLCGSPLKGWISGPMHDTLDCKPHIQCTDGCGYFHAEGQWFSLYDKGASKALALQSISTMVKPYIKVFGSPLEEDF